MIIISKTGQTVLTDSVRECFFCVGTYLPRLITFVSDEPVGLNRNS